MSNLEQSIILLILADASCPTTAAQWPAPAGACRGRWRRAPPGLRWCAWPARPQSCCATPRYRLISHTTRLECCCRRSTAVCRSLASMFLNGKSCLVICLLYFWTESCAIMCRIFGLAKSCCITISCKFNSKHCFFSLLFFCNLANYETHNGSFVSNRKLQHDYLCGVVCSKSERCVFSDESIMPSNLDANRYTCSNSLAWYYWSWQFLCEPCLCLGPSKSITCFSTYIILRFYEFFLWNLSSFSMFLVSHSSIL